MCLLILGFISGLAGELDSSRGFYERGAELASKHGYAANEANALTNLASIALRQERYEDAEKLFPGGWTTVKPYLRTLPQPGK